MKAAIISLGSISSKMTATAMEKYFDSVDLIKIKEIEVQLGSPNSQTELLYQGEPLSKYDCVYVKGSFNYATVAGAISGILAKKAYCPIDESAFTIVHDKTLSHIALQKANIPTPQTYLSSTSEAAKAVLKNVTYPIILKFPKGTHGKGVMFADSYAAAASILDALVSLNQPFLIQEYIETNGADVRAFVVGDEVIAAMKRKSAGEDKRSNTHMGGTGESYILDPKTRRLAIDTAKALKMDICGVDILEGPKGGLVIEANASPGLQGITKYTDVDVADKIAQYLYKKTTAFNEIKKGKIPSATDIIAQEGVDTVTQSAQQVIMNIQFRGNRILLPEMIAKISKFEDEDEVTFDVSKHDIHIKKM
ncbi:MAG: ribosomal protein S6--L-glutamate ligase [Candidatus Woesearchaeota archaeon]|jgi:ribosomal protein S6--L-glutamate ligase